MRIRIITIFPHFFDSCLGEGLLGKADEKGLVRVETDDLRAYTTDRHRTVDDTPYGGGPGMVMKVDVWDQAIAAARAALPHARVVLLTPQGPPLDDRRAARLAHEEALVFCCGRYEGVDERVAEHLVDEWLSIGDYVLTGGEAAALVAVDAIARKVPGVIGDTESVSTDTFTAGLKFPQYTRPPRFKGWAVPEVLLSGDHDAIARWREEVSWQRTAQHRPELLTHAAAGRIRLVWAEPPEDQVQHLPALKEAYGLRDVGVAVRDPERRAALQERFAELSVWGTLANAGRRWSDDWWLHVADAPGPEQWSLDRVAARLGQATPRLTISFGGPTPRGATAAAPALPGAAGGFPGLVVWLDRLMGGGEKTP